MRVRISTLLFVVEGMIAPPKEEQSMRTNAVDFRRSGVSALGLALVLMAFIIAVTLTVGSRGRVPQSGSHAFQANNKVLLSVEDPRPLAKAIQTLEDKYGFVITYEDPRYTHASEIIDVTLKVRKDLNKFKPGKAPKVLIPKGGTLSFGYDEALTVNSAGQVALLQELIDMYSAKDNAGSFRVEQRGRVINVIPTAVKNTAGEVTPQASVLDALIALPAEQRSGMKTLQAICSAISQASGTRVLLVGVPLRMFLDYRDEEGIVTQPARDALAQFFSKVRNQEDLSWQLLYDPGLKMYTFNVRQISANRQAAKRTPN